MERELGVGEKFWYMASRAAAGNGVLRARVRGPLTEALLRPALDAVQRRHPLLGVHVEDTRRGPRFVSGGTAPIALRSGPVPDGGWLAIAEQETGRRFGAGEPLARAILLHDEDAPGEAELLLVVDHLVVDAISGGTLLRDILRGAVAVAEGREPEDERLPERPAADHLLPEEYQGLSGMRHLAAWMGRTAAAGRSRPVQLEPDAQVADDATVSRLIERPLTAEATGALLERCDAEQASLMGAVTAAALVAVREDIAARGGPAAPTIACQSTVDVRRMLRPRVSRREVGLFASGVVTMQQVAPGAPFWDLARGASARYRDAVFRGEHFVGIPLGRAVQRMLDRRPGDTPSHYMALMRRMSPAAFAVSVMSGQPIERERIGEFELLDVGGLTGLSWLGPMLLAADRVGDRLRLGLVHAEPVLARERALALAERMGGALETAAGVTAGASAVA